MRRPRWHDALITLAILGVALAGVWALWGPEVTRALGVRGDETAPPVAPVSAD
ncbi:MAG: hypothetical protein R3B48_05935 [Kofleriaceae bacterium]